jgi:hypothetical protein
LPSVRKLVLLTRTMKGLRSRAQRQATSNLVLRGLARATQRNRRYALGRKLQLPTDKAALRAEAERLIAERKDKP